MNISIDTAIRLYRKKTTTLYDNGHLHSDLWTAVN